MAENSLLGPRYVHWRVVCALVAVILLPSVCAAWLNGWTFFSFPLGTFLVWIGVPLGLIAVAMMIPRIQEEEAEEEALDP